MQTESTLKVLVVDDSPMNLQKTGELLSRWGIFPTTASNGAEAIALTRDRQFDIVVMDIDMPILDGLETTRLIRQREHEHPERPHTPIVAYTTGWLLTDTTLLARVGVDGAIEKPCSAEQMEECLLRWSLTAPGVLLSPQKNAPGPRASRKS